jgi:hypothetical protein
MADNPFDFDVEEDEKKAPESQNFKDLRDYAKRIERENKAFEKQVAELSEFKTQVTAARKAETLKSAGLTEKHAALFLKVNGDVEVTPEGIQAFVTEYELPVASAGSPPEESVVQTPAAFEDGQIRELTPQAPVPGFAPTPVAGQPSQRVITELDEAQALAVSNPNEYMRLKEAGRIQLQKLPGSD